MNILAVSLFAFLMLGGLSAQAQDASQITNSAEEICPILIGAEFPDATLKTHEGVEYNLLSEIKNKRAIVIYYRGGWCPYCNRHLKGIMDVEADLLELGYEIIAISADDVSHAAETMDKKELSYTLLSDSKMSLAQDLGIAFKVDEKTIKRYKTYGIDLDEASGEPHHVLPVPAVFILGKDGAVKFTYVNPNYSVRLNGDVLLAAAKAAKEEKK